MEYDGLQTLIDDHNTVRDLFDLYWSIQSLEEREPVKNQIIKALSIHDTIERLYLYPLVDQLWGPTYGNEYRAEHEELAETLYLIDHLSVSHPEHDELMSEALNQIAQHLDEEEGKLFPALRAQLSREELQELGYNLDAERNNAPTHPHPGAPMDPMELREFGAKVLPVDQALDDLRLFPL